MPDTHCPILVGCGQLIQRNMNAEAALGPIDMMSSTARTAAADAGPVDALLASIDHLRIVRFLTGVYKAPCGLLSKRLGIEPSDVMVTETGGDMPQLLVNDAADKLAGGECKVALLCGAEALASFTSNLREGTVPKWVERDGAGTSQTASELVATAPHEVRYECHRPINVYPLFENAIRARYARDLDSHQRYVSELYSRFSAVAADNPYAWFRQSRTPEEIATVTPENRLVGFPYTKYMNAIIQVDQSAAIIMTTVGTARELGIDESRWVFLHGCSNAQDHWFISDRENFYSSPAIRAIGRKALTMAGCTMDDIDYIDLYSCFPSAVQIAMNELGIAPDDQRPLTVTGGLAYAGGPGSNYVMHSIATTMDLVRRKRGSKGLCTGLGWYITRHAIGIYSTDPIDGEWSREDPAACQAEIDAEPHPEVAIQAEGNAVVETYTVLHKRDGAKKGLVIGRLEDGRRFLSFTSSAPAVLEGMTTGECVGRTGRVNQESGTNIFSFD